MASDNATKFVKDGLVIGGTAALVSVGAQMALRRTNYSYAAKGGLTAAAAGLAALALANRAPRVAIGLMGAAVTAGVQGLSEQMRLQNYLARVAGNTPARGAVNSTTGTSTSGALGSGRGISGSYADREAIRAVR